MVKVRPSTPEEEAEFDADKVRAAAEAGEIKEGNPEELAQMMLEGYEVILSENARASLKEQGISEDEFIAMLLKSGNRVQ